MKTVNEIFIFIFHTKSLQSDSYFSFRALLNLDQSHFKCSAATKTNGYYILDGTGLEYDHGNKWNDRPRC